MVQPLSHFKLHIRGHSIYARSYGGANYTKYTIADILPVSEIMFEGHKFMAPRCVDTYLINQFGSTFMEIPEASERIWHASTINFFD